MSDTCIDDALFCIYAAATTSNGNLLIAPYTLKKYFQIFGLEGPEMTLSGVDNIFHAELCTCAENCKLIDLSIKSSKLKIGFLFQYPIHFKIFSVYKKLSFLA